MKTSAHMWLIAGSLIAWVVSTNASGAQDFSGGYAGIDLGYRWSNADVTSPAYTAAVAGTTIGVPANAHSFTSDNPLFGAHAGYNYFIGAFLIGAETDIMLGEDSSSSQSTATKTVVIPGTPDIIVPPPNGCEVNCVTTIIPGKPPTITTTTATVDRSVEFGAQGTIRGRLGFVTNGVLLFATGGVAFSEIDWRDVITLNGSTAVATSSDVRTGWVVGGGFETFVTSNLIFRAQYLYEDFGSFDVPLAGSSTAIGSLDATVQKVMLGLSFKF